MTSSSLLPFTSCSFFLLCLHLRVLLPLLLPLSFFFLFIPTSPLSSLSLLPPLLLSLLFFLSLRPPFSTLLSVFLLPLCLLSFPLLFSLCFSFFFLLVFVFCFFVAFLHQIRVEAACLSSKVSPRTLGNHLPLGLLQARLKERASPSSPYAVEDGHISIFARLNPNASEDKASSVGLKDPEVSFGTTTLDELNEVLEKVKAPNIQQSPLPKSFSTAFAPPSLPPHSDPSFKLKFFPLVDKGPIARIRPSVEVAEQEAKY